MTEKLFEILSRRHKERRKDMPWIFWHTYWSSKTGERKEGPYTDRKKIMHTLCKRAGVKYFRFHAFRHLGASMLAELGISIEPIQKILGHENRTTTEIYLHSLGEAERRAMDALENMDREDNKKRDNKGRNGKK
jgi:integrase